MKVAIAAPSPVPFTRGGAERAWSGLHAALLDAGHDAEVVKLPVAERTLAELGRGYRAFAGLDLTHFDAVVSSKYPAWICPHPHHVLWMFHPLRGLYDTYHLFDLPTVPGEVQPPTAALLDAVAGPARRDRVDEVLDALDAAAAGLGEHHPDLDLPGPVSRAVVHWLDRVALAPGEIARHTALSRTVAARPGYLPEGVRTRVAHAPSDLVPPDDPRRAVEGDGDDDGGGTPTLFTASRIDGPKRLDLLVRAMAHVPGEVRLLVGGTGPDEARVRAFAAHDPRIRFLGFVPDEELVRRYATARAVPFVPLDEDYGLITVEAMALGTPVVTCTDSGGAAELVRDGVDGLVVEPTPEALGRALTSLLEDPGRAARLGEAARARAARITWPAVVRTLLGPDAARATPDEPAPTTAPGPLPAATPDAPPAGAPTGTAARRPKAVVLATFRVADRGHGGQLRSFHLYGALARHLDVEIVSLTDGGPAGSTRLAPGLVETAVPTSDEHRRTAERETLAAGVPVSDVVAGSAIAQTPEYLRRLRAAAHGADVIVLAEPYLLPALDEAGVELPVVYDAFNVEAALKAEVLPPGPHRGEVLARVVAVEEAACRRAAAITACSVEDAAALTAAVGRARGDAVVVPNGTDVAAVEVPSPARRRRRAERWLARYRDVAPATGGVTALALFLGSWHPPNLVAANIVVEVAPDLPEVLFAMGGRHGDAFDGHAVPPNVVFTGVVSSTAKATLLGTADVAVNPMATGSGTNLKLIEYLAAGVPVVTSYVGARGVDVVDGEHLLVADDLVAGVRAVLAEPDAAARRAEAGRALVEDRYDWSALGDRLAEVVLSVARR